MLLQENINDKVAIKNSARFIYLYFIFYFPKFLPNTPIFFNIALNFGWVV